MSKLLILSSLAATVISTTCLASPYIKISSGAGHYPIKSKQEEGYDYTSKVKQEEPTGFGELSFGYNLLDNNRMELAFGYSNPKHEQTGYVNNFKADDGSTWRVNETIKIEATINTTMLKSYIDFIELGRVRFFFGAGVGAARIEQTIENTYKIANRDTGQYQYESSPSRKATANNFAYSIMLGSSVALHKSLVLEGSYGFTDLGKVKHKKDLARDYEEATTHYKSHNIVLGLRINLQ